MLQDKAILIVDDDITLLEMYVERLRVEGAVVLEAKDGEEAIEQARENHPAIILLDIMMPKVDGFKAMELLKNDPETKNIPIVILSALAESQKRKMALDLGAADFIVKSETLPVDVIGKLDEILSKQSSDSGAEE